MTMPRTVRRAFVAISGGLLFLLGLLGSALPILPGLVFLVAGLLVWSTEFAWARQLLARVREWIRKRSGIDGNGKGLGVPLARLPGRRGGG